MYLALTDVTSIVIGVAGFACLTTISVAIVIYARKHPEGRMSTSDNLIISGNIINQ